MTYQKYRTIDLSFFTLIGMIAVLISEGAFSLMPEVQFRLSLLLLVGFIAGVRWGKFAIIPYLLSMMCLLLFNQLYENFVFWSLYYIVSAIGFILPIEIARSIYKKIDNNLFKLMGLFIISFISQALFASIFSWIVDGTNLFGFFLDFIAVNLLNIVIATVFIIVLFKSSNELIRNMDIYLKQVQEELEDDVKTKL